MMKKTITKVISMMLVAVLLLCSCPVAFADDDFDFEEVLGEKDGYEYDKFDKTWTYAAYTSKKITDGCVVIAMVTGNEEYNPNPIGSGLYFGVTDKDLNNVVANAISVDFLIGEDVYSYKSLIEGAVVIGPKAQWLTEALVTADIEDIAIRVTTEDTHYDFDAIEYEWFDEFLDACRIFNEYFVKYYEGDETIAAFEESYPLTINGKTVENPYSADGSYIKQK